MNISKILVDEENLELFIKENPLIDDYILYFDPGNHTIFVLRMFSQVIAYAIIRHDKDGVCIPYTNERCRFKYYLAWIQVQKERQRQGHSYRLLQYILKDISEPILLLSLHRNIYLFARTGAYLLSSSDVLYEPASALMFFPQRPVSSFKDISELSQEFEAGEHEFKCIENLKCNTPSKDEIDINRSRK